jgi:Anti-sigma-D factor RsdA to sigma factor binding region
MSTRHVSLSPADLSRVGPGGANAADEEPVDLVSVQADDELINALASGMMVSSTGGRLIDGSDEHVSAILAAWKADVDAAPIPELITVDEGVAAVRAAGRRTSSRIRHLAPLAAAAAFIVVTVGGVSVGSYSAQPEDALWPVAKVLYSERTESVEAAGRVETRITRAKQAIAAGQPAVAEQELKAAAADLAVVRPEEGKTELAAVQDFLVAKAGETPPGVPTDPGAPLAADQARTVPPGASITSPARSTEPSSPVDRSTTDPGSSSPNSGPTGRPVLPAPVDPQVARVVPADPEPAKGPKVSTAPSAEASTPPEVAPPSVDSNRPTSPEVIPPPVPVPVPVVPEGTAPTSVQSPVVVPDGAQSLGATTVDPGDGAATN